MPSNTMPRTNDVEDTDLTVVTCRLRLGAVSVFGATYRSAGMAALGARLGDVRVQVLVDHADRARVLVRDPDNADLLMARRDADREVRSPLHVVRTVGRTAVEE